MSIITENNPIQFHDPLPERTDVIIIGGGIAGVMTAWFLQQAGQKVLLCEKGRVAGEQSCRNWGFVRQAGRDVSELPIMMDCMPDWQALQDEIGDEIGFRRPGSLFISTRTKELAGYEEWAEKVGKPHGLPTRMLSAAEIGSKLKLQHSADFKGGLYTENDGCAEPFTAVPAIAKCLHAKGGVKIRENCAVRLLDIEAGRVVGVHTEEGTVKADKVLLAGGLWSGRLLYNHGLQLPQLLANTTLARTEPVAEQQQLTFGHSNVCFRSRVDGGYNVMPGEIMEHELCFDTVAYGFKFLTLLKKYYPHTNVIPGFYEGFTRRWFPRRKWGKDDVTPFEQTRVLNPRLSKRHFKKITERLEQYFPELAALNIEESWTGSTDMTPDMLPALSAVNRYDGLYIASGLSGHGFGLGPGVGKTMANLILENPAHFDLSAFRFERFSK